MTLEDDRPKGILIISILFIIGGSFSIAEDIFFKTFSLQNTGFGIIMLGTATAFFIRKKWARIFIITIIAIYIMFEIRAIIDHFNIKSVLGIALRGFILYYLCKPNVVSYYNHNSSKVKQI